jgi:nucleoside-diphosphate-sugar epimerase
VSRNIASAASFDNLAGSNFVQADTRDAASLAQPALFKDVDAVVISVGTTAFPTSKWEGDQNTPRIACLESVENILNAMGAVQRRPKRVFLISSIGVERSNQFPFLILNWHKVLEYKKLSEQLLLERSKDLGFEAVVVRPGRLVGAPFTNFDLARLLQLDQGATKGVTVSAQDTVAGDMERRDVARAVISLMEAPVVKSPKIFSIVNAPGQAPTDEQLAALLSSV